MIKKLAATGILGFALAGSVLTAAPASADITSGAGGVLSGNQVFIPISIPVNVCGNAVAVIGIAGAGCKGGAHTGGGHGGHGGGHHGGGHHGGGGHGGGHHGGGY